MFQEINLYSNLSKFKDISALQKIVLVFLSLIYVGMSKDINMILLNCFIFILINYIYKNPLKVILKIVLISLTFSVFSSLGLFINKISLSEIILINLRSLSGALSIGFLALTTPITSIAKILSRFDILRDISDLLILTERFLIIIEEDYRKIFISIKSRYGFRDFKSSIKDLGKCLGSLFKNMFNRLKEIKVSSQNRCYRGRFYYRCENKLSKSMFLFIFIYVILFILKIL